SSTAAIRGGRGGWGGGYGSGGYGAGRGPGRGQGGYGSGRGDSGSGRAATTGSRGGSGSSGGQADPCAPPRKQAGAWGGFVGISLQQAFRSLQIGDRVTPDSSGLGTVADVEATAVVKHDLGTNGTMPIALKYTPIPKLWPAGPLALVVRYGPLCVAM